MYALIPPETDVARLRGLEIVHRYARFLLVRGVAGAEQLPAGGLLLASDAVFVNGLAFRVPEGEFARAGPRTIVRFAGPIAAEWSRVLDGRGVRSYFWCPPFGVCCELPETLATQSLLAALPTLVGMQPYRRQECTRGLPPRSKGALRRAGQGHDWIDVVCFEAADAARVEQEIRALGGHAIADSRYKLRVRFTADLAALRSIRGVKIADPARAATLAWSPLRMATGLPPEATASDKLSGKGQVVAVADTGLDTGAPDAGLHADFAGRVRFISSWPVNASWHPYVRDGGGDDGPADRNSGHGTHVAGLVLGAGTKSNRRYQGLAPEAELVFQSIEQYTPVAREYADEIAAGYYLSGRPMDLRDLFDEARAHDARIHVNAWGDPAAGSYTDDSYEVDDYLRKHPDAIILFAAGNEGADRDGDRQLDRASLYAPASAKNAVAVGALEGPRAGVGYRGTWEGFDPARRRFRHPLDRRDAVSGRPEHIALISSSGPTVDGRIKPDICAPGTNLPAPKSQATAARGWGLASPLPYYMYMGGTSMATAVAGGAVALLRQAWQAELGRPPSGAALKALLLFGARPVWRRDARGEEPRHVCGFGRIVLANSLPGPGVFLEDRAAPRLATGESDTFRFTLAAGAAFRAVLAWYDAPGERLINDLDLCLTRTDGVTLQVWGNHLAGEPGVPDRLNTVERISIKRLEPGDYLLEVIAANVPGGVQGYALASTHGRSFVRRGPALPLAWLKGIGAVYQSRLAAAGIETLDSVLGLESATLAGLLGISERRLRPVTRRLGVLAAALQLRSDDSERALRLTQLTTTSVPDGIAKQDWQRLREKWQPLLEVFDKGVHHRIRVADLFTGE